MKLDTRLGRFASEKENFYLSCNTDNAVLVGMMEKGEWTCPVLGLVQHMIPLSTVLLLQEDAEMISLGNWNDMSAYVVSSKEWELATGEKLDYGRVLFIDTDHGSHHEDDDPKMCIIRLHMEFE